MGKKVKHDVNVVVEDGVVNGSILIQHGSLKHNAETTGLGIEWTCLFKDVPLKDVMEEAARNISVRMATMRELPFEEFRQKRRELNGASVAYENISTWTTKGRKGMKRIAEMSTDELLTKLTPEQIAEIIARAGK